MKDLLQIKEKLSDTGLTENEILRFSELGDIYAQIRFLKDKRNTVLSAVHEKEKNIQRIDYLIYKLGKGEKL